jgi:hypothetical protein
MNSIMAIRRKSFDDWTTQEVRMTFNLELLDDSDLLTEWLSKTHAPSATALEIMEERRQALARFYRYWNEDELKFQFIAQIVMLAKLRGKNYNTFSQRNISALVNGIVLHGRPEVMVATGQEDPLQPYFFIHEYKPSKRADEPLGQVLAAMVAARALNANDKPLLGCIVIGNTWQFLILEGDTYTISRTYDATKVVDLQGIYAALCQARVYIELWTN